MMPLSPALHEVMAAGMPLFKAHCRIAVPIPSRIEHIRVLEHFGRPKDLARAELLRAL